MITKTGIEREVSKLKGMINEGGSDRRSSELCGAIQAMRWILKDNAMRPSKAFETDPFKDKP